MKRTTLPPLDSPAPPPRPTIRKLPESPTDPLYLEILRDYEESIMAGNDKDTSAAVALIGSDDHDRLLADQLTSNPNWLNDLTTLGRTRLKGLSRRNVARRIEEGDASMSLSIAERTNQDLSPKPTIIATSNTYVMPEEEKKSLLDKFANLAHPTTIIDVAPEPTEP